MPRVAEVDAGYMGTIALDAGGLHAEMNANTRCGVAILKKIRDFRGHRARHDAVTKFDHVHLEALGAGGGGELQADEARPDDDDTLTRRDPLPQCCACVEDSQI